MSLLYLIEENMITSDNIKLVGIFSICRIKLAVCRRVCRLDMHKDGKRA